MRINHRMFLSDLGHQHQPLNHQGQDEDNHNIPKKQMRGCTRHAASVGKPAIDERPVSSSVEVVVMDCEFASAALAIYVSDPGKRRLTDREARSATTEQPQQTNRARARPPLPFGG